MKTAFSIPHRILRAAALIASVDTTRPAICGVRVEQKETDAVLIVGTDGRRIVVIRHVCKEAPIKFDSFTIPAALIQASDFNYGWRKAKAAIEDLDLDVMDETGSYSEGVKDMVIVSFESETQIVTISKLKGVSVSDKAVEEAYPVWRKALNPAIGVTAAAVSMPINPLLLSDICQAAKLAHGNGYPTIHVTACGQHERGAHLPAVVSFRNHADDNFFAALMAINVPEVLHASAPDWALAPAEQTAAQ